MSAVAHHPVTIPGAGSLASRTLASDLLQGSKSSIHGMPLKTLGKAWPCESRRTDFTVSAKARKVKKHDYPWSQDPDPNVKGGILRQLSSFKPLKEKPKPVTLDFEKPLLDLQKKIIDVQKMANDTGLDFTEQIISLEKKYQQALHDLYTHLTPIQRVHIARHPNRPTYLDHVFNITEKFLELHGDRAGYDDPAIVTGLGSINGRTYMFIGHQKGRNTKENIKRNFGMPTPHGYRKALRMMYYADHHEFPIVTFIDTPGAFADLKSEELGQGEAIAHNLRTMFGLKVPVISIVIGEGGSGGALAIGCANKLLMLENAVFYVASPEACAAILWKSAKAAPKAAEKLKITAKELCKLQIADGVIPEPLGGAHADPDWTSQQIKTAILDAMDELTKMDTEELLRDRMLKFRKIGGFQEGIPIDPERKINMKRRESPKQNIVEYRQKIRNLKGEIVNELTEAVKALGLEGKLAIVREAAAKAKNSKDDLALKERANQLEKELLRDLAAAPNYARLKERYDTLDKVREDWVKSENKKKAMQLKQEANEKLKAVMGRPGIQQKFESLKAEIEKSGASSPDELNQELKEKILQLKDEIDLEFTAVLEPLGLRVGPPAAPAAEEEIDDFTRAGYDVILHVMTPDLRNKIETWKMETEKAGDSPDTETRRKIDAMKQEIKQELLEALNRPEVIEMHAKKLEALEKREKHEKKLKGETHEGSNGSLIKEKVPEQVTEEVNT